MDIVKKNLVSIICGVIAIVAIVATFYPMNGEFDKLNKQLVERNTAYSTAEGILAKTRQMPVTDLVSSVEPPPLKYFPSPAITKTAKTFLDQLIAQSRGVLEEAVKINKLESVVGQNQATLLTPDSLPEPKNNADNTFKKALVPEYEFLKLTILGAGYPPTADEIKKADDKLLADPRVKKQLDANQQVLNEEAVQKAYQEDSAALPQKLRTEMAMKSRIYLDPEALIAPKEITTVSQSPSPTSIWFAQAALWVQEDTCRAISEANQSSANVLDAPINPNWVPEDGEFKEKARAALSRVK